MNLGILGIFGIVVFENIRDRDIFVIFVLLVII